MCHLQVEVFATTGITFKTDAGRIFTLKVAHLFMSTAAGVTEGDGFVFTKADSSFANIDNSFNQLQGRRLLQSTESSGEETLLTIKADGTVTLRDVSVLQAFMLNWGSAVH